MYGSTRVCIYCTLDIVFISGCNLWIYQRVDLLYNRYCLHPDVDVYNRYCLHPDVESLVGYKLSEYLDMDICMSGC